MAIPEGNLPELLFQHYVHQRRKQLLNISTYEKTVIVINSENIIPIYKKNVLIQIFSFLLRDSSIGQIFHIVNNLKIQTNLIYILFRITTRSFL